VAGQTIANLAFVGRVEAATTNETLVRAAKDHSESRLVIVQKLVNCGRELEYLPSKKSSTQMMPRSPTRYAAVSRSCAVE